ncbi:hypothetical protein Ancab_036709, partial [Ancistrocladus abbreviatus]
LAWDPRRCLRASVHPPLSFRLPGSFPFAKAGRCKGYCNMQGRSKPHNLVMLPEPIRELYLGRMGSKCDEPTSNRAWIGIDM